MLSTKGKVVALALLGLGLAVGGGAPRWGPSGAQGAGKGVAPNTAARAASPEVDLLLFLDGSTHFFREEYEQAARVFNRLAKRHPSSRLAPEAVALAALARRATEADATARRASAEGRARIKAALGLPAQWDARPADVVAQQAEKDFNVAEFYRRTGHLGAACFYYELVSRRYPDTPQAARAAARLRELRKHAGEAPQADAEAPARVGRIVVNGNRATPEMLIRYQLALYPGQVLTYPSLSAAERNLAALRGLAAVVSVRESDNPGAYKELLIQVEEKAAEAEARDRGENVPVLPPLRPGRQTRCADPPDWATILRALPRPPQSVPGVCEVFRDGFQFTVEVLVDRLDAPRFYPLVGIARMHHCHYKCVVSFDETVQGGWPFPFRSKRRRSEVVYVDRDHLHLVQQAQRPGAGAAAPPERPGR